MHHTDAYRFLGTATGWNLFSGVYVCFAVSDLKLAATPRRPSNNGRPLITIYKHSWPYELAISSREGMDRGDQLKGAPNQKKFNIQETRLHLDG